MFLMDEQEKKRFVEIQKHQTELHSEKQMLENKNAQIMQEEKSGYFIMGILMLASGVFVVGRMLIEANGILILSDSTWGFVLLALLLFCYAFLSLFLRFRVLAKKHKARGK